MMHIVDPVRVTYSRTKFSAAMYEYARNLNLNYPCMGHAHAAAMAMPPAHGAMRHGLPWAMGMAAPRCMAGCAEQPAVDSFVNNAMISYYSTS
eukprot:SAG31_NODE_1959_length_6808_cov_2.925771_3_plen_93_part_00